MVSMYKACKNRLISLLSQQPNLNNSDEGVLSSHALNDLLKTKCHYCVNSSTPKSRVTLVYNYGESVDIVVSFAVRERGGVFISKGLAKFLKTAQVMEKLGQHCWKIITPNQLNIWIPKGKSSFLILIVEITEIENGFALSTELLNFLNDWAKSNYPLIIGIDIYTIPGYLDFPALEVLNAVMSYKELCFVFYNKGYRDINFLKIPKLKVDIIPNPAGCMPGTSQLDVYVNSMIELKNILLHADTLNAKEYRSILESAVSLRNRPSANAIELMRSRNINIYNNESQAFIINTVQKYRMGYTISDGYVAFCDTKKTFSTADKYILVTDKTELMLNAELIQVVGKIDIFKRKMPKLIFVEGCPGSGKSHFIIHHHHPGKDLVLTHTREAVKDIREAVADLYPHLSKNLLWTYYRTISSFIINFKGEKHNKVFIDEVSLGHTGYIGVIANLTQATEMVLLGDTNQIPYIERSPMVVRFHKIADLCTPEIYLTITKRCPIDIAYILSKIYPNIVSRNQVVKSVAHSLKEGSFCAIKPGSLILTFTQVEKNMVLKALERKNIKSTKVCTVHESQGKTAKHVILCRINPTPVEIYRSIPHVTVAISRHSESLHYITTNRGDDDLTSQLLNSVANLSSQFLLSWNNRLLAMKTTPRENVIHSKNVQQT